MAPGRIVRVEAGGQDWIVVNVAGELSALAPRCLPATKPLANARVRTSPDGRTEIGLAQPVDDVGATPASG